MTNQEKYNERLQLIQDTIDLKPTHRVVNATRVEYWPYFEYGMTLADALKDFERGNEVFYRYHREFQPDIASVGSVNNPSRIFELAGLKTVRWPGDPKGLDVNAPYQFVEFETLYEDEYDEFFDNPIQFTFEKFMPRTADIFAPFQNIDWQMLCAGIQGHINAFTTPDMIDMYKKLIEISEVKANYKMWMDTARKTIGEMGIPDITGTGSATAFDMLADSLRCTMGFFADLIIQPDNVRKALDMFVKKHIDNSIAQCKAIGTKYAWVMLHKAFDNFISDETYRDFYWPYLRQWIMAMIENDLVPVVYTEGPYSTRLKYLADVPPGKVIYHFEEVDLKAAKRELGGIACMMGGYPAQTLMMDKPEKVRDRVKELLDIMAPGGGYMFCTGSCIDHAPRANMEALFQAVEDFGKA